MVVTSRRDAQEVKPLSVPEVVEVDRFTECHVTPPEIAERMVDYLGPQGDYLTLEPSAGTGNLLHALFQSGQSQFETIAVERHAGLCSDIRKRFPASGKNINPVNQCFLEYAQEVQGMQFPRIIMNPPFRQVRQHIKAALSLLGRNGHDEPARLVAMVPITYQHEEADLMEELERDAFAHLNISTKIIRISH
jgi:phospholipid N-methyltransferase